MFISPLLGPLGVFGVLTVSVGSLMETAFILDQLEVTLLCIAHRAWAMTW